LKGSKPYIENARNFFIEVYRKSTKKGVVKLKDFLALNRKWDKSYRKIKRELDKLNKKEVKQ
jgi:hypothetical protein